MKRPPFWRVFWAAICLAAVPLAHAQFAVIDVGAITQLIEEIRILEDQLTTAREHLAQAQAEYESITGGRGMERLLGGIERNYLPATWPELQGLMQGGGAYGFLGGDVASALATNSILTPQQLSVMPPGLREQYEQARRLTALNQGLTHQALATTSERFAILHGLIDAIGNAPDQKAILDLHARIGAETTLLQNEQSKLATLSRLLGAEQTASRQRIHELSVAGLGDFATRFQPVP